MKNDKTGSLADLGNRLRTGLGKINSDAKAKAEGKPSRQDASVDLDVDDLDLEDVVEPRSRPKDEGMTATDDINDPQYIIDGESVVVNPKPKKGLGTKQKVILIVALVAAAWFWTNSKTPLPSEVSNEAPAQEKQPDVAVSPGQMPGPSFELSDSANDGKPDADLRTGFDISADANTSTGLSGARKVDAANDPIGSEQLTDDLNDQLGNIADDGNEVLDPFSGEVRSKNPPTLNVAAKVETHKPSLPAPTTQKPSGDGAALGLLPGPDDSPFGASGSKDVELSGTKNQKPDSKGSELLDQNANADVANLKASLAEKDGRIGKLEAEMGKLKTELAAAKEANAKTHAGNGKSPTSKAPLQKPAQAAKTTQRSPQAQRVATAPKAIPRPQICVTAVAQAARNCTTCVPHAFISHRGSETTVGQGDFLDGLRVNIVGDRLDLQNAQGDVVHKFWSSPNGCAG